MTGKNCVYFYYGASGELLYIGKAIDVGARWKGHTEPWMEDVRQVGIIECPDRAGMDVLERYCIVKMPTKYNKDGLEHGYTRMELFGMDEQTMYSVEEFKNNFVQKVTAVEEGRQGSKYAVNVLFDSEMEPAIRARAKELGLGVATYIKMCVTKDLGGV